MCCSCAAVQAVEAASRNADRYYRLMGPSAVSGTAEDPESMARAFRVSLSPCHYLS
jgi:hypothetical protein